MRAALHATIGEYHLVDFLGTGGMGEVYRAVHSKTGKIVAVKVLTAVSHTGSIVERFCNEAHVQAGLHHPNIAAFYDFGEFDGRPCIVMEYVEGRTLHERIQVRGCLSLAEALSIFQAVVETLGYVHDQGILHRDIKPANIKITSAGTVKLLDFGIAKTASTPNLTLAGNYVGTLQYLSPEQLTGKPADVRSDIWSLGVLFYEMMTGKLPFDAATIGKTCEKISKVAFVPPSVLNRSLPPEVEMVISCCLRKHPADRYQSVRELLHDIRRLATASATPRLGAAPDQRLLMRIGGAVIRVREHLPMFLTIVALVLTLIVSVSLPKSAPQGGKHPQPRAASQSEPSVNPERTIEVNVLEGPATVYQNGQVIGMTPHAFSGVPGERIDFVLKRDGYKDKPVTLYVQDINDPFTYLMERREQREP